MKKHAYASVVGLLLVGSIPAIAQPETSQPLPATPQLQTRQTPPSPSETWEVQAKQYTDAIFAPKSVKIPFRWLTEKGGQKQVYASGAFYYSNGDLFVLYERYGKRDQEYMNNYATINGKLYEWQVGTKQGKILKRINQDTQDLLGYLLDISSIKKSTYKHDYLKNPENFTVTQEGTVRTLKVKTIEYGFVGIRVQEDPLWLQAFLSCRCKTVTPDTEVSVHEVDRPIPLEQIPEAVKILPSGVKFEKTEETVESRMVYI